VDLGSGYSFGSTGTTTDSDVTSNAGYIVSSIVKWAGGNTGDQTVQYLVTITASFPTPPTFTIRTSGWAVKDTAGTLATIGFKQVTLTTTSSIDGAPFDSGTDSVNWIEVKSGLVVTVGASTQMTIDTSAAGARKKFLTSASSADGLTITTGALTFTYCAGCVDTTGVQYALGASDTLALAVAGNTTGISRFVWAPISSSVLTGTPGTNLSIVGTKAPAATGSVFVNLTVDGSTALSNGTTTIALTATYASGQVATLLSASTFSVWSYNGTILISNWSNGNSSTFKTRYYFWNPATASGAQISVRIFEAPIPGSTTRTASGVTTGLQIGSTYILPYTMGGTTGLTIRLQEDLLTPMGITADQALGPDANGNLVVEFTIQTLRVTGYNQVFTIDAGSGSSSQMAFGTTPLTVNP